MTGRDAEALRTPRVHFPYLHAVPPDEEPTFRRLLTELRETHTFVTYSEAVGRVLSGAIDRPYAALSFDDGFASNLRTAGLLADLDIPACFFVTTGFIGTRTLAEAHSFFGYSQGIDEPAMTWADLERLKEHGHEVGNHTVRHRRVSDLSTDRMAEEIGTAAEALRSRLGGVDHFAWPFGRWFHFTPDAVRVVFETGHRTCASAERGAHPAVAVQDPLALCVRRDHVMTSWPLRHTRYLLAASARRVDEQAGATWPPGWDPRR
jgi:peptidoglycan/xylan/chitin deacetylase (PgdA/CDA1 family)